MTIAKIWVSAFAVASLLFIIVVSFCYLGMSVYAIK